MMPLDASRDGRIRRGRLLDAQASALAIDGHPLDDMMCWLEDARLGEAGARFSVTTVPGMPGALDLTAEGPHGAALPGMRECEFDIATDAPAHMRAWVKAAVGRWNGRSVEALYVPMGGHLKGRMSVGAWEDGARLSRCTLRLTAQPYLIGPARSARSGTVANVGGNAPALPAFSLSASAGAKSVSVLIDGVKSIEVPSASGSFAAGARVEIDCAAATVLVNGNLAAPTLASDFPALTPGGHRFSVSGGSGDCTWRDMWNF